MVSVAVDDKDAIIAIDVDAVAVADETVAEGAEETPLPVDDDQRRKRTLQDEQRALAVDGDLADETQLGPVRQITPGPFDPVQSSHLTLKLRSLLIGSVVTLSRSIVEECGRAI